MVVDYLFRVVHAAVTDLDGVSVEDFSELVIFGKVLHIGAANRHIIINFENDFAIFLSVIWTLFALQILQLGCYNITNYFPFTTYDDQQ